MVMRRSLDYSKITAAHFYRISEIFLNLIVFWMVKRNFLHPQDVRINL